MSLFQRGGTYTSYVWLDGVRHARALHTGNRKLAEKLDRQHRDELIDRQFQPAGFDPAMSFDTLCTRFLAEGDVKPHHAGRCKFLLGFFGDSAIGGITRNDVIRYRKERHELFAAGQAQSGRRLSEATVNRDLEVLRRILFWAVDEGIISQNPIARAPMVRERRRKRPIMPVAHELKLLAASAKHLASLTVVAIDTGMRRGELLRQLWEDVDFDRRLLFVTHSKTAEGEKREIPLTARAFDVLESLRKPHGPVFTYKGDAIGSVKTGWAAAVRRAGIPRYRFHDLRHTFNSRLVEVQVISDVRKELMGHSPGRDVHSLYTHVELPLLRDAIARLEAWHTAQTEVLKKCSTGAEPTASQLQSPGGVAA